MEKETPVAKIYISTSLLKENNRPGSYAGLIDFTVDGYEKIEFSGGVPAHGDMSRIREYAIIEALERLDGILEGKPVLIYVPLLNCLKWRQKAETEYTASDIERFAGIYHDRITFLVDSSLSDDVYYNYTYISMLLTKRPVQFLWKKEYSKWPVIKDLHKIAEKISKGYVEDESEPETDYTVPVVSSWFAKFAKI